MYLICYGTRPEIIKLFPLINKFNEMNIKYKTLFSGQHIDLFNDFKELLPKPDFILENVMEHNQSLNKLSSKILLKIDNILNNEEIKYVIIQGDTTTAYTIAYSSFNKKKQVIHLEAGLRTYNKTNPFPEEMNRCLISQITNIHLCPTSNSVLNLNNENIKENVYLVGNTVVDSFDYINKNNICQNTVEFINKNIKTQHWYLVTLHRRENRGENIYNMWNQLNEINNTNKEVTFIYICHPSLPEAKTYLDTGIIKIQNQNYNSMCTLINKCNGIITDSGGLQEEAVCACKNVLICRNNTERPETIESGWGKLIGTNIKENINFLINNNKVNNEYNKNKDKINPYGNNVCNKIIKILSTNLD